MNRFEIFLMNVARRMLRRGPYSRPLMRRNTPAVVVPFAGANGAEQGVRMAAVLHIFYPELAAEMKALCANIPEGVEILISTDTDAKAREAAQVFGDWSKGAVHTRVVPNRGRDMLSKFYTFADVLDDYDLVLFLHSKRSKHLKDGAHDWGKALSRTLAASPAIVASILALFRADPRLGIVSPEHFAEIRKYTTWGENRRKAEPLAQRAGIDIQSAQALDFPSGSMFWARPRALKPLLDLKLVPDDFPAEDGQVDGTPAHALERLIYLAAETAGYKWLKIVSPDEYPDFGNRVVVADVERVGEVIASTYLPLIKR